MELNLNRILRFILVVAVITSTIYFFYLVREVLLTFILGAILAYLLYRPVTWVEKQGLKRVWAILVVYLLGLLVTVLLFSLALPGIIRELGQFASDFPRYANEVTNYLQRLQAIDMPSRLQEVINSNVSRMEGIIYKGLDKLIGSSYQFLSKLLALVFSPILAFYILNDWEKIRDGILDLFSPRVRLKLKAIAMEMDQILMAYIKSYLFVAVLVGVMVTAAAALLGVKFPLLLGILSGVTNLIPYFGAFLSAIPAVGIAWGESWRLALYMSGAIFLIQQLESNLITPRIIGDSLGLHPLVVVFALLAGGELGGLWGLMLAVPGAAILKLLLSRAYLKVVE